MWIDKKRQVELEQRKGLSSRTAIVVGVLFIGVVAAYIITGWLFSAGILTPNFFYRELSVPQTVSPTSIRIVMVFLMVVSVQFLAILALALLNPENRKRPGQASAVAQSPDFYDGQYDS